VKSTPVAYAFLIVGLLCLIVAVLYEFGVLQILVSDTHASHHTTHAILFGVLAIASFIAFNFARQKA
jgi:Na+/H+ antiporter NhaC